MNASIETSNDLPGSRSPRWFLDASLGFLEFCRQGSIGWRRRKNKLITGTRNFSDKSRGAQGAELHSYLTEPNELILVLFDPALHSDDLVCSVNVAPFIHVGHRAILEEFDRLSASSVLPLAQDRRLLPECLPRF